MQAASSWAAPQAAWGPASLVPCPWALMPRGLRSPTSSLVRAPVQPPCPGLVACAAAACAACHGFDWSGGFRVQTEACFWQMPACIAALLLLLLLMLSGQDAVPIGHCAC